VRPATKPPLTTAIVVPSMAPVTSAAVAVESGGMANVVVKSLLWLAGEDGENVAKRLVLFGFGTKREDHMDDENAILV